MCPKNSLKNGCIFFFRTLISVFLSQIVKLSSQKNVEIYVFVYRILAGCAQRGGGLAQAGGTLSVIRTTNSQFTTKGY